MAWRLRYAVNVDWVGQGMGPMTGSTAALPLGGGAGPTLNFQQAGFGPTLPGSTVGPPVQLTAGDITTILASMSADLSTQLNAALGRLNTWPTGGT